MHISVPLSWSSMSAPSSTLFPCTASMMMARRALSNGSAKPMWPTTPPSKYVHGRTCSTRELAYRYLLVDALVANGFQHALLRAGRKRFERLRSFRHRLTQHAVVDIENTTSRSTRQTDTQTARESNQTHPLRPIHHLIRHHEIPRLDLLPQAAYRAERHHAADAQLPQRGDVRPRRHLVRRQLVVQAVPREECHVQRRARGGRGRPARVREDRDRRGGRAPGREERGVRERETSDGREGGEMREAGAADDGDGDGAWRGGGRKG